LQVKLLTRLGLALIRELTPTAQLPHLSSHPLPQLLVLYGQISSPGLEIQIQIAQIILKEMLILNVIHKDLVVQVIIHKGHWLQAVQTELVSNYQ